MTIIQFNPTVEYISPDAKAISATIESTLKLTAEAVYAFEKTRYLPSLHAKAAGLYPSIRSAKSRFDEMTQALEYAVSDGLKTLHALRNAGADKGGNDDTYFRDETVSDLKTAIRKSAKDAQTIYKSLADITFDPTLTTTYQTALDTQLAEVNRRLSVSVERRGELEAARKTLNDGMAVLEKNNFTDIAKNTLLSAENISAMAVTAPEAEMIRLAVAHLTKMIDDISKGLNYLGLYEQRERLLTQIEAVTAEQNTHTAEVKFLSTKVTLIKSIHGLYESFFGARAEWAKLNQSVAAFANHLEQGGQEGYEDRFVSAAPACIDYLVSVR